MSGNVEGILEEVCIFYSFDLCNYINILHIKDNKDISVRIKINLNTEYREKQMNQKCLLNEFMKTSFFLRFLFKK